MFKPLSDPSHIVQLAHPCLSKHGKKDGEKMMIRQGEKVLRAHPCCSKHQWYLRALNIIGALCLHRGALCTHPW